MFGFRSRSNDHDELLKAEADLAKLFFDSFSKRLGAVEEGVRTVSAETRKLKAASERSQISDLVLLERLQKLEEILEESLTWIRRVADTASSQTSSKIPASKGEAIGLIEERVTTPAPAKVSIALADEGGSFPSVTTATELTVLTLLAEKGPLSSPEIGKVVGRSREHSARLMKKLYDEGYVRRDQSRIPFRYALVDRVRQRFRPTESKNGSPEEVSVPQN